MRARGGGQEESARIAIVVAAAAGVYRKLRLSAERYCHEELLRAAHTILQSMYPYVSDATPQSAAAKIPNENSRQRVYIFGVGS